MHVLLRRARSDMGRLQLDVPHDPYFFCNQVVSAVIYFGFCDLELAAAAEPRMFQELSDEEVLDEPFAVRGMQEVLLHIIRLYNS